MKKAQWILIGITGVFLCIIIGVFIGRNGARSYIPVNDALSSQTEGSAESSQNNDGKININTATEQQLTLLPGVGEATAKKIITYREENGDFAAIEDLMKVSGIGEKKFEQMKPYIKVE